MGRKQPKASAHDLADAAPAILWETRADGACTFISRSWTEFTGQQREEALGWGWVQMIHPEDRDRSRDAFIAANEEQRPFNFEYRIRTTDRAYSWAFAAARPRHGENGEYLGFAGLTVNIDDRRRAEERLRISEERMRLAAEVARVGTFEWNIQANTNVWTPELEAVYGMPAGSFAGSYEAWRDLVHPEDIDKAEEQVQKALETGEFGCDWRIIRPDGAVRWIEARGWVFRDSHGEPLRMVGVNFDVTERKLAEEALREASRRKDQFLAVLAHELRNPLGPVRNAAAILTRVDPAGGPAFYEAVETIERQVAHMARLTDDLLNVSQIARGHLRLRLEITDLSEVVRQTVEDYRWSLEVESGLSLSLDLPADPVWVEGDPVRLAQAIGNLLHNAGKFTEPGGRVAVQLVGGGGMATIAVTDTGLGLTGTMRDRAFEPFIQADASLDRQQGGLGLGLALVKGLMELHGGSVSAESAGVGQGSTFTLGLPSADAPPKASRTGHSAERPAKGLRVLVIEDHSDAAASLSTLLALDGHEVMVAPDGLSGIEAARDLQPQVVLCDLGLPGGMDGFAVARVLRADSDIPPFHLIALTGYGKKRDRAATAEAGFDRHLLKPVDLRELRRVFSDVADNRPEMPQPDPTVKGRIQGH